MESGAMLQAVYDFETSEAGELSFKAGQTFKVVSPVDDSWVLAEMDGRTGNVPVNYVQPLTLDPVPALQVAVAVETFDGTAEGDLSFAKGESITVLEEVDSNWLKGRVGGKEGIFPASYVDHLPATTSGGAAGEGAGKRQVRAIQDLTAQLPEELSFTKGSLITVVRTVDGDWYEGSLEGRTGLVPAFCVEVLEEAAGMLHAESTDSVNAALYGAKVDYTRLNDNLKNIFQMGGGEEPQPPPPPVIPRINEPMGSLPADSSADGGRPWVRAVYPFSAESEGELSFIDGERIDLHRRIDPEWLQGEIQGKVGIFPGNYVEVMVSLPPDLDQPLEGGLAALESKQAGQSAAGKKKEEQQGRVLFDFNAEAETDVTVGEGEVVVIVEKVDNDWYEVRTADGRVGFCPVNYVQAINKPKRTRSKRQAPPPPAATKKQEGRQNSTAAAAAAAADPSAGILQPTPAVASHQSTQILQPTAAPASGQPTSAADTPPSTLPSNPPASSSILQPAAASHKLISPLGDLPPLPTSNGVVHATTHDLMSSDLSPTAASTNTEVLVPAAFKSGSSAFKPVVFSPKAGKSLSGEGEAGKAEPLHRQDAVNSLEKDDDGEGVAAATAEGATPGGGEEKGEEEEQSAPPSIQPLQFDAADLDTLMKPTAFSSSVTKPVRSVPRPVKAAGSLTSDFDPLTSNFVDSRPSEVEAGGDRGRPGDVDLPDPSLETKLRSISQASQELDEFFGTTDSFSSRMKSLDMESVASAPAMDPPAAATTSQPQAEPLGEGSQEQPPSTDPFATPLQPTIVTTTADPFAPFGGDDTSAVNGGDPSAAGPDDVFAASSFASPPPVQQQQPPLPKYGALMSETSFDDFGLHPAPVQLNFSIRPSNQAFQVPTASKLPPPPPSSPRKLSGAGGEADQPDTAPKFLGAGVPRPKPRFNAAAASDGFGSQESWDEAVSQPGAPVTKGEFNRALESLEWNLDVLAKTEVTEVDPVQAAAAQQPTNQKSLDQSTANQASPDQPTTLVADLLGLGEPIEGAVAVEKPAASTAKEQISGKSSKKGPPRPGPPRPAPPQRPPPPQKNEDDPFACLTPEGEAKRQLQKNEQAASIDAKILELQLELEEKRESKKQLDSDLKVASEDNRDQFQQEINDMDEAMDSINAEIKRLQEQLVPLRPDPVAELKKQRRDSREKVLEELVQTERDYVKDLKLCAQGFMGSMKEAKSKGIELDVLFGNMDDIIAVSEKFLASLEQSLSDLIPPEDQLVGTCFLEHSKELEDVYSQYCHNHDDATALLEKYEENPDIQAYINDGLEVVRQSTNCWDLASFLIKPVQRILKYPLLLNELIKMTPDNYKDKNDLLRAISAMTDVATTINEFKRRKDLVMKYRGRALNSSISKKLGKVNLHSIKKKSNRFNQKITQRTGLVSQTIDEEFNEEERRFKVLEKTIKMFVKDISLYLEQLQEANTCQAVVGEDIADYYATKALLKEVGKYSRSQRFIADKLYKNYVLYVHRRVVSPLLTLLNMYQGPHKLISKRYDKLLDYDSAANKMEKLKDKEKQKASKDEGKNSKEKRPESPQETSGNPLVTYGKMVYHIFVAKDEREIAKKNYEALNTQLLEELPRLYQMSVDLLRECVIAFVEAQRDYVDSTLKQLYPLLELPMVLDQSTDNFLETFEEKSKEAVKTLSEISFVPANFDRIKSDRRSKRFSTQPAPPKQSPQPAGSGGSQQLDSQRAFVVSEYPGPQLYQATSHYQASQTMDLSVAKGDVVGVVKDQDPSGKKDRWYVDNGAKKGFLPTSVLMHCGKGQAGGSKEVAASSAAQQSQCFYYAEWVFEAAGPNEVSLYEGEAMTVLQMQDIEGNSDWWLVENDQGQQGYVPANYLSRVEQ